MAEETSESGGGNSFNWNTILALLTLFGSIFLVSQRLSTSRPMIPGRTLNPSIGEQTIEARLWEDPLSASFEPDSHGKSAEQPDLDSLLSQIKERTNQVLFLPVMLSGGSFGEDQESRIRARFAIVSALGLADYAPEDAEHLGALEMPWPNRSQLKQWQTNKESLLSWSSDSKQPSPNKKNASVQQPVWRLSTARDAHSTNSIVFNHMHVRYEWYRLRTFRQNKPWQAHAPAHVLVLWLDDTCFEDEPLFRLPLFFRPLVDSLPPSQDPAEKVQVALIGPRRSATLRAMLPGEFSGVENPASVNPTLWEEARKVLARTAIYSATASAMDEVLTDFSTNGPPRSSVQAMLTKLGFGAFHNFAATDAQLAGEVLAELKLRGADPGLRKNHIVLISEWDTFYARNLSLTYSGVLATQQDLSVKSLTDFVSSYRTNAMGMPSNLHSFVYLRGLDGQSAETANAEHPDKTDAGRDGKFRLLSMDELRQWSPDANKAEGPAQFDYLGRLGDRIEALERKLRREKLGSLKAIGIVGSDIYDTLLILQALRPRFANSLFFTTDLDARLWHPREVAWTRNLIVASGYGLQLEGSIQQGIAPFRESVQSSQFAATLAVFHHPGLIQLGAIPPRRFEIGRKTVMDLSVASNSSPHPRTRSEYLHPGPDPMIIGGSALALITASLLAACYWKPLRRLTWENSQFQAHALLYHEEDLGGTEGSKALLNRLLGQNDPFAAWLRGEFRKESPKYFAEWKPGENQEAQGLFDERRTLAFLHFLNSLLRRERLAGDDVMEKSQLLSAPIKTQGQLGQLALQTKGPFLPCKPLLLILQNRAILDDFLTNLAHSPSQDSSEPQLRSDCLKAAEFAREAGKNIYRLRRNRAYVFRAGVFLFLIIAGFLWSHIQRETFLSNTGEPFSLVSGTSAWPTEIIRLAALALSIGFVAQSYHSLRTMLLELTRRYRFHLAPPSHMAFDGPTATPEPETPVCATFLWEIYQQRGMFRRRFSRVLIPLLLYALFGFGLMLIGELPLRPLRGAASFVWDNFTLSASSFAFAFLAFWIIDASFLCVQTIEKLSHVSYPEPTRDYFSKLRGGIDSNYLTEWITLQLVADLTERVGRLVYCPFIVFSVLLLARSTFWDNWPWPPWLVILFIINLVWSSVCVVVLQKAARKAKARAEESLEARVKALQASVAPTPAQNNASQAEDLLSDLRRIRRGAFVPFWQNPVVGAILLAPGSTVILELFLWMANR
jgi:hypothetical protein